MAEPKRASEKPSLCGVNRQSMTKASNCVIPDSIAKALRPIVLLQIENSGPQMNKAMLDFSAASRKVTTPPTSTPSINSSFLIPMTSMDIEQATNRTP